MGTAAFLPPRRTRCTCSSRAGGTLQRSWKGCRSSRSECVLRPRGDTAIHEPQDHRRAVRRRDRREPCGMHSTTFVTSSSTARRFRTPRRAVPNGASAIPADFADSFISSMREQISHRGCDRLERLVADEWGQRLEARPPRLESSRTERPHRTTLLTARHEHPIGSSGASGAGCQPGCGRGSGS